MLAAFPLTTARDRRWWSHCRSLGSPDISTRVFARPLKKGWASCHTHQCLNCNWLKVVIALKVMAFLAFCSLSLCSWKAWLSCNVFVVTPSKSVHKSTTVASHTRLRPLYQGPNVNPSGLLLHPVKPKGSNVEGRSMPVNNFFWMELMAECLGKRSAFLVQERTWSPSSSTIFPQRHFVLSKILAPVRRAIAIRL